MTNDDFKIGDKVEVLTDYDGNNVKGKCGTVVNTNGLISIEFKDKLLMSHGALGTKSKNCWGVSAERCKLVKPRQKELSEFIGDIFKSKRVKVVKNGNIYRLIKSNGDVIYTYIPFNGISKVKCTKNKTEKSYIDLFNEVITAYQENKEMEERENV